MKRISAPFLILFLISLFSFSQNNGYQIKGKIKGWHDTICYLGNYFGKFYPIKDSTQIDKNGNFIFKGKENLPGGIYFVVFPNKTLDLQLLIDKEQNFSLETDTSKVIEAMKIKGSEENVLFYKYLNFISKKQKSAEPLKKRVEKIRMDSVAALTTKKDSIKILQDKSIAIEKEVEKYKEDFITEHPGLFMTTIFKAQKDPVVPDAPTLLNGKKDSLFPYTYYKDHFWDNIPPSDDRLLRTPIFHMKLKQFFDKVVIQNPDSINKESDILVAKTKGNKETFKYIVWYMTLTYENNPIMGMDAVFVHQINRYYKAHQSYWVDTVTLVKTIHKADIMEPLLLGKLAPRITLQDSSDKNISLYDLRSKYTVLIFWDPDCGYCQKVLPKLKENYDKTLKSKGVEVFSVDIEDNSEKWKKFIVDNKLKWINTHDKYKQYFLRDLFDIYSTPVIYLLDEDKKIKAKRIDVDQLDGYIDYLDKIKGPERKKSN
jgi:peroxiredoxin